MTTAAEGTATDSRGLLRILAIAYAASVPLDILPFLNGRSAAALMGAGLVAVWVVSRIGPRQRPLRYSLPMVGFSYLYFTWITASGLWSAAPSTTIVWVIGTALQLTLLVVLKDTLMPRDLRPALLAYGLSSSVLSVVLLLQPAVATREDRANLDGIDENITAFAIALGLCCILYFILSARWSVSLGLLPLAGLLVAGVAHTGSRAGVVATVAACVAALLWALGREGRRNGCLPRALVAAASTGLGLILADHYGLIPARVTDLTSEGLSGVSDSGRGDIVGLFLDTAGHWIVTGVGYGADAEYLRLTEGTYHNAHSLFWKTLVETGIVGLILLTVLIAAGLWTARRSPVRSAVFIFVPTMAVFAATLGIQQSAAFWFVVAVMFCGVREYSITAPHGGNMRFAGIGTPALGPTREMEASQP